MFSCRKVTQQTVSTYSITSFPVWNEEEIEQLEKKPFQCYIHLPKSSVKHLRNVPLKMPKVSGLNERTDHTIIWANMNVHDELRTWFNTDHFLWVNTEYEWTNYTWYIELFFYKKHNFQQRLLKAMAIIFCTNILITSKGGKRHLLLVRSIQ